MLIPTSQANKINKYSKLLFSSDISQKDLYNGFYYLIKPLLVILREQLLSLGLLADEVESELYIFSCGLCQEYDKSISSLSAYLKSYLPWRAKEYFTKLRRAYSKPSVIIQQEEGVVNESYYWRPETILIENRYVGKHFTRVQKYIIYVILMQDNLMLSEKSIANVVNVDRKTYRRILSDIRDKIKLEEI